MTAVHTTELAICVHGFVPYQCHTCAGLADQSVPWAEYRAQQEVIAAVRNLKSKGFDIPALVRLDNALANLDNALANLDRVTGR
jgi:hypothetical protein